MLIVVVDNEPPTLRKNTVSEYNNYNAVGVSVKKCPWDIVRRQDSNNAYSEIEIVCVDFVRMRVASNLPNGFLSRFFPYNVLEAKFGLLNFTGT